MTGPTSTRSANVGVVAPVGVVLRKIEIVEPFVFATTMSSRVS